MDNCKEVTDVNCPLQKVIAADEEEIKQWIKGMNETKIKVNNLVETLSNRPKTSTAQWISMAIGLIIFASGIIYSAGLQRNVINTNTSHISDNKTSISNFEVKMSRTDDRISEIREVLAEVKVMCSDIKDIKQVIIKRLAEDKIVQ